MPVASFRVHGVRYQTRDVNRAVAFYTQQLGFELKHQQGSAFRNRVVRRRRRSFERARQLRGPAVAGPPGAASRRI